VISVPIDCSKSGLDFEGVVVSDKTSDLEEDFVQLAVLPLRLTKTGELTI